ncbi:MAG: ferritin-like domain-containing protein [Candidatus Eisenbacteria bacterium]|nr:ferritin-like domain-containing protein [Candidatus Eisenbacteria bacterium]
MTDPIDARPAEVPAADPGPTDSRHAPGYDFGGATFDLESPQDREIVRFILSQALYGEATGVYCGKSLYAARSLEAAQFYVRQAAQELRHLEVFGSIFRELDMRPSRAHWVIRFLSTHNNYYPVKVMMEHLIGEGLVLDLFRDVLMQTLPDSDPRVPPIKRKLEAICRDEEKHVAWGERETRRLARGSALLRTAYFGILELQLALLPVLVKAVASRGEGHPVLGQTGAFLDSVRERLYAKGREVGFVPVRRPPGRAHRAGAIAVGAGLLVRSRFARSRSKLEKSYIRELGLDS